MITIKQINEFLAPKKLIVAGVSRDEKKFGNLVFKDLINKGYDVCPVNRNADEIDHVKCYNKVTDIPDGYDKLLIITPKDQTMDILIQAKEKGIDHIWIQQSSENKEVLNFIKKENINAIYKKCVFMFTEPVTGGHKFHRRIVKFFGGYPK